MPPFLYYGSLLPWSVGQSGEKKIASSIPGSSCENTLKNMVHVAVLHGGRRWGNKPKSQYTVSWWVIHLKRRHGRHTHKFTSLIIRGGTLYSEFRYQSNEKTFCLLPLFRPIIEPVFDGVDFFNSYRIKTTITTQILFYFQRVVLCLLKMAKISFLYIYVKDTKVTLKGRIWSFEIQKLKYL